MNFAFCLTKYFPFGGLQRDFLRMAALCLARGHRVDAYTTAWQGQIPEGLNVSILKVAGWTNHRRTESFASALAAKVADGRYDAVVGFNKMPGLDLYFAADPCYAERVPEKGFLRSLTGRQRTYLRMEAAVFGPGSHTRILSISEPQQALYIRHYGIAKERFYPLPPGISPDRLIGDDDESIKTGLRSELGIVPEEHLILMVGSDYRRKGVDRAVRAIAALPDGVRARSVLVVVGRGRPGPYRRLAKGKGIGDKIRFMGSRSDVPRFLAAADLLLHPAYEENTGTVLIEALAANLPVLVTEVCGYSSHIRNAGAGKIVPSPFSQEALDRLLAAMLTSTQKDQWRQNARRYVAETDLFSLSETAVEIIEQVGSCTICPQAG